MTPTTMKQIAYLFITILIIIAIYPIIDDSFYSPKFTEIAILGPTGKIGEYHHQIQLGEELSLNIYLENHEKQTKLYKIVIKMVENSSLQDNSSPFVVNPVSSYHIVLGDDENTIYPIKVAIEQPFSGKLVAELYMFDASTNTYLYHNRWVAIWMKTTE